MKKPERMLYQVNLKGYYLLIAFIALNTFYTVFILNEMDKDSQIGIFVMLTIFLILLGFFLAIKLKTYSVKWSYLTIIIGIFQGTRIVFTANNTEGALSLVLDLVLMLSALLCITGGVISLRKSKIRNKLILQSEIIETTGGSNE